ncbi:NADH-quinone oxidoreductase subunit N [Streptomyces sp. DSM 44917]|uniref:NADH-quinone oxidoreductase subunit N n=1 Tax=Streptomyces boetiae TaxID=3075541 RepID=A0ABU2LFZ6_9ACTN|nr:NADH-quinone oxidoreductase subunit N [Streptomyces sp. DSM 44917]MDT0310510.1 NADH-quinone oxidoreductase subunit N [Streptomyces sp. DSM 44917]
MSAPTSMVQSVEWAVIAPPVIAAAGALAVLAADLFLPEARKRLLGPAAAATLALALLALLPLRAGDRTTFCAPGGPDLCSYAADRFALTVQLLVLGGAFLTALLSLPGERERRGHEGEFWFLLLSSASGAALLPAARDLATLVLALEVTTLPAYALVALRRGPGERGPEAALTFFLSSITATAVSLLGIGFVYAGAGTLYLDEIAARLPGEAAPELATVVRAGVVLTLVGFVFKAAAVPFHFWVPDTYAGAPLPVAGYLSVVGKAAGLAGLILVAVRAFPGYGGLWGPAVAVLAGLTMTVGNAAALRTDPEAPGSAIRLLAWSSVGQAGYLLVPVAAAAYEDTPGDAVGAALAYGLMYAAVNLGAFAVAAHVARRSPAHRVADYRGLYARRPLAALALAFFLLCLAGLPPGVIGLFAKVAVFATAVEAGLAPLAVAMAVNVALALVYYLRWTALLFRGPEPAQAPAPADDDTAGETPRATPAADVPEHPSEPLPERLPTPLTGAIALSAALGLALSAAPQLVLTLASGAIW